MKNFLMNIAMKTMEMFSKTGGGTSTTTTSTASEKLKAISEEVNSILSVWVGPLLIAIGGVGAIYMIVLGIQYAKSENDNKRAEVKTRLINCLIGVIAILVLGSLCIGLDWASIVQVFGYASE